MSKGINLEELRSQLETDATKRSLVQEKTIIKQRNIISSLQDTISKKEHDITALSNRCYTLSKGSLCIFCMIKARCLSIFRKEYN